jgi:hypothetical protein
MFVPTLGRNLFSILTIAHKDIDVLYTKIGCRICTKKNSHGRKLRRHDL